MASLSSLPASRPAEPGPGGDAPARSDGGSGIASGRFRLVPALGAALLGVLAGWGLGRRSFWVDEAISVGATNELVATWKGTGGTMAMYYAILTPWSAVSTDRSWLRVLSVVFALAAVAVVWAAAQRVFDRRVATLTTLFTASSWLVVRYAQEARSYSLMLLLTSVSWLALLAAIRSDDEDERARWWRVYLVVTVISPLAHGLAVLQFAGQAVFLWRSPTRKLWLGRLKPVVIGVVGVMGVLVVAGASDVASWIPPVDAGQVHDLVRAFTGPGLGAQLVLGGAIALGTWVCVARSRQAVDATERWMTLAPIMWGLVPLVLLVAGSIARPYLLARYVVGSAPGVAMLLALAVLGPKPKVTVLRAGLVLLPIVAFLGVNQVDLHHDRGDAWSATASTVSSDARPGDAIVFPNPSVRSAFDYAWNEQPATARTAGTTPTSISPVEPIGAMRRFYVIQDPADLTRVVAASKHERVWVVDEDGIGFEDTLSPFLADRRIDRSFRIAGRHRLAGSITVVLLERR